MADFCDLFIKHSTFSASSSWQHWEVCFLFVDVIVKSREFKRSLGNRGNSSLVDSKMPCFSGVLHSVGPEREKSGASLSFQSRRRRLWTDEGWIEQGAWLSSLGQYCLPSTKCTQGKTVSLIPIQRVWDTIKITRCLPSCLQESVLQKFHLQHQHMNVYDKEVHCARVWNNKKLGKNLSAFCGDQLPKLGYAYVVDPMKLLKKVRWSITYLHGKMSCHVKWKKVSIPF